MRDQEFAGKVALVTGGASGIGEACVHTFAAGGAKVVIVDMSEEQGERTAMTVRAAGGEGLFLRVDVSDPGAVEQMVADAVAALGRVEPLDGTFCHV